MLRVVNDEQYNLRIGLMITIVRTHLVIVHVECGIQVLCSHVEQSI